MITANLLPRSGVPGDYNGNGTVDAADYVTVAEGRPAAERSRYPGTVNAADYTDGAPASAIREAVRGWRLRCLNPAHGRSCCRC